MTLNETSRTTSAFVFGVSGRHDELVRPVRPLFDDVYQLNVRARQPLDLNRVEGVGIATGLVEVVFQLRACAVVELGNQGPGSLPS